MEGKLYNVEARISLLKKDFTGSASAAERALGFNRASGDGEEEANSLRLLAEAKAAVGLYDEALALYEEALSVDKALGLSRKIALDLMGAGAALLDKGDPAGAKRYFERALSVSEAGGAEDIKGEASSRLQEAGGR
jgi:tetratricopeptide (TPR) repeat protein